MSSMIENGVLVISYDLLMSDVVKCGQTSFSVQYSNNPFVDNFNPYMGGIKLFWYLQKIDFDLRSCSHLFSSPITVYILFLLRIHLILYPTSISISIPIIILLVSRFHSHRNLISSLVLHTLQLLSVLYSQKEFSLLA